MEHLLVNPATKQCASSSASTPGAKKPRIESSEIFDGNSEVVIVHQNEEYNLRITRNGKLILTK